MAAIVEVDHDANVHHTAGLNLQNIGDFESAEQAFRAALDEAFGAEDLSELERQLQQARILRDLSFLSVRRHATHGGSIDVSGLEESKQLTLGILSQRAGDLSKGLEAHVLGEHGATLAIIGRTTVYRAYADDHPNSIGLGVAQLEAAYTTVSKGDNGYYVASTAAQIARAEASRGESVVALQAFARASGDAVRTFVQGDVFNAKASIKTVGRVASAALRGSKAAQTSILTHP